MKWKFETNRVPKWFWQLETHWCHNGNMFSRWVADHPMCAHTRHLLIIRSGTHFFAKFTRCSVTFSGDVIRTWSTFRMTYRNRPTHNRTSNVHRILSISRLLYGGLVLNQPGKQNKKKMPFPFLTRKWKRDVKRSKSERVIQGLSPIDRTSRGCLTLFSMWQRRVWMIRIRTLPDIIRPAGNR